MDTGRRVPLIGVLALLVTSLQAFQEDWSTTRTSEEPEFLSPIPNLTVPVGREAIFSCTVNNLGKYKVAWVRAEDQTILSMHTKLVTHNSRIGVTHDNSRTWRLRIRQLKESDRGCYMCQINTSIMKIQQGCLDVYVPPDIVYDDTSGDLSVSEGENATLWCRATGRPPPRITWRREDGQPILMRKGTRDSIKMDTYNGSNLYFWRLDRRQMGAYLCIASNDVPPAVSKRIALNVNFAPAIKVPNQLLGTPLNTDVQLECYVEAFPNTINYWVKNRGEMLLNGLLRMFSDVFDTTLFLMTILSIFLSCVTTYLLSILPIVSMDFIAAFVYQLCIMISIYLLCWYGTQITYYSSLVSTSLYTSEWTDCKQEYKKSLQFIMLNTQPIRIVPGGLMPLSTDSITKLIKASYSFYALLKNSQKSKYTIREERSGYKVFMWLIIRNFSPHDIGTYNCVSTNSLGRAEGTLRLYEIKVGPGGPHDNHISIVGGLAEPARGHRSRDNVYSSSSLIRPVVFQVCLAAFISTIMLVR